MLMLVRIALCASRPRNPVCYHSLSIKWVSDICQPSLQPVLFVQPGAAVELRYALSTTWYRLTDTTANSLCLRPSTPCTLKTNKHLAVEAEALLIQKAAVGLVAEVPTNKTALALTSRLALPCLQSRSALFTRPEVPGLNL